LYIGPGKKSDEDECDGCAEDGGGASPSTLIFFALCSHSPGGGGGGGGNGGGVDISIEPFIALKFVAAIPYGGLKTTNP